MVNIVVDVLLIFGMSKYEWDDKLFKYVLKLVFKWNIDTPEALTSPVIFKLLKNVELLLTFKLPFHDILF